MCLAVPAELVSITNEESLQRAGRVSIGGIIKEVNLACVPDAAVGDYLLIHAGVAINVIDQDEAKKTLGYLSQISELQADAENDS